MNSWMEEIHWVRFVRRGAEFPSHFHVHHSPHIYVFTNPDISEANSPNDGEEGCGNLELQSVDFYGSFITYTRLINSLDIGG